LERKRKGQQGRSKLIFNRYNDNYFLRRYGPPDTAAEENSGKTQREKEIALSAKLETQSQVILVASVSPSKP